MILESSHPTFTSEYSSYSHPCLQSVLRNVIVGWVAAFLDDFILLKEESEVLIDSQPLLLRTLNHNFFFSKMGMAMIANI